MTEEELKDLKEVMNSLGFDAKKQIWIIKLIEKSGYSYTDMVGDYSRAGGKLIRNKLVKKMIKKNTGM